MKPNIYCTNPKKGQLYFYLYHDGTRYYLFQQPFRKSVCAFFGHGVYLDDVFNYSRAKRNPQIVKTISKLPYSIRYIESEYGIAVLERTKKWRNQAA
ncbi:MAG: hypothetical protein ACI3VA_00980 [Candidatus Limivicinus sp.]